jgi:hypothetical protein
VPVEPAVYLKAFREHPQFFRSTWGTVSEFASEARHSDVRSVGLVQFQDWFKLFGASRSKAVDIFPGKFSRYRDDIGSWGRSCCFCVWYYTLPTSPYSTHTSLHKQPNLKPKPKKKVAHLALGDDLRHLHAAQAADRARPVRGGVPRRVRVCEGERAGRRRRRRAWA